MGAKKEVRRGCPSCLHENVDIFQAPCVYCYANRYWEPKVKRDPVIKMCRDCENENYCSNHSSVRIRCHHEGMSEWSPINVTKEDPKKTEDLNVANQAHYTRFKIQPVEFIKANGLGYLEGNVIKYVCRYPYKGQAMKDLLKARDYIDHLIKKQKEKE